MTNALSARLKDFVDALPLEPGLRVLEIGCGPGAAARAVASLVEGGFVLGIDRSDRAIEAAVRGSQPELASGRLQFRQVSAEQFQLEPGEEQFDLAFAIRVGAFDGRHPAKGEHALKQLRRVLRPGAKFYIDGGSPLREVAL
jgi:ubiquinone/menaquinone biosynthesis C-methylase UbiE